MLWAAILTGALGCYLLKLAGLSVPARVLQDARAQKLAMLLPVGLLTALIVVQTFSAAHRIVADDRLAGMAVALVAVRVRAPFVLVVALAAATTAVVRLVT